MSGELEQRVKELNSKVAELSLLLTLKNTNLETLENRYNQRLEILNKYIDQLHDIIEEPKTAEHSSQQKGINSKTAADQEEFIADTALIKKLSDLNCDAEFIVVPLKHIKSTLSSGTLKSTTTSSLIRNHSDVSSPPKSLPKTPRKTKFSCSNCNEKGHKRSHCPKILYRDA